MTREEMAKLLNYMAVFDSRVVTDDTVVAYHDVLGHLDVGIAKEAVQMFHTAPLYQTGQPKPYLDPRELKYWYSQARERRDTERARARAGLLGPEARKKAWEEEAEIERRAIERTDQIVEPSARTERDVQQLES